MRPDVRRGLLALALVASCAHAAVPAERFATEYPIAAAPGAPAYVVSLPQDAYTWSRPDTALGDIVVVDATGQQVPSGVYQPPQSVSRPVTLTLPLLAVPAAQSGSPGPRIERSTNGDIVIQPGNDNAPGPVHEWLIDARTSINLTQITLPPAQVSEGADVRLDNVSIDVSDDLQTWTSLIRQATILSRGHGGDTPDVTTVKLEGGSGRYFRVRIVSGSVHWATEGEATAILAGRLEEKLSADEAPRQWLDVQPSNTRSSGQGVDYDYTLAAALPIDALRLTRGHDAVARVDAMALDGEHLGESLGTLVVTAGQGDGSTTLEIPAGRRDALRLHSATPLRDPPRLALGWVPDRFVFVPEGQAPYRLLVGSRIARRPAWPIGDALAGLRKQQPEGWRPVEATVGPGERMAGEDALAAPEAPFDWTRVMLWVVLGAGVLVVVGMAASLLRKPPSGPREEP
ncbi:MAG TPA: DUF3999 family protein [Luteibacter sp.]|uniref:DUF3999 family protein n=1 Tax=Luteibacter sp. TaxID=1886636 RepID=UPI002C9E558F|nr:DUF3999 family protein [Luteibacter sp.]HVI56324.1 DUF3999 family protein [Luteibacter sp.]